MPDQTDAILRANENENNRLVASKLEADNQKLRATVAELQRQQQESGQRMRDHNNIFMDTHKASCEAMLQTIVNLTDANAKLRVQNDQAKAIKDSFGD